METKQIYALMLMGMMSIYGAVANWEGQRKWRALGCYKNREDRPHLKHFLGYARPTTSIPTIFKDCKKKAQRRKFDYFGIQNGNECWGSCRRAYGYCSRDCIRARKKNRFGVGLDKRTSFVYYNKAGWTFCKCGETKRQYRLILEPDQRPNCPGYNKKVIPKQSSSRKCCRGKGKSSKFYGPWSPCSQLCGHGGIQTKNRTCPEHNWKCYRKPEQKIRDCNCRNCPSPCSFDGTLMQLLRNLTGVSPNNHMIAAFSEVYEAMDTIGSKPFVANLSDDFLLDELKASFQIRGFNAYDKDKHARTLLGVLLYRHRGNSCDYANVVRQIKDEIGEDGFKSLINADGKVTLTFVIDISAGSWTQVIQDARAIVKNITGYRFIANVDYVLSVFTKHDTSGRVQTFSCLNEFTKAIEHLAKQVQQESECTESTYAAIIEAITQGNPKLGSPMYVFTDTTPSETSSGEFTKDSVIHHAQKNKMSVNFFLYESTCLSETISDYEAIAKATGGFSLSFISASSVNNLELMVKGSLDGTSLIATTENIVEKNSMITRDTDDLKDEFTIEDIAHGGTTFIEVTENKPHKQKAIKLFNPTRKLVRRESQHGNKILWTIHKPDIGTWRFNQKTRAVVKSQTDLDINFEVILKRKGITVDYALRGEKATVEVTIPFLSRLKTGSWYIPNWTTVEEKYRKKNREHTFILESNQPLINERLKMVLHGQTLSGFPFSRESSRLIQPKIAEIRHQMPLPWIPLKRGKKFTYNALIDLSAVIKRRDFQIEVKTKTTSYDWITKWNITMPLNKGENTFSVNLTAPTNSKTLTVKIMMKDPNESVDIDVQNEKTFNVE